MADRKEFKLQNQIALLMPEIPYNTGNIARTCVVTESRLHLVRPLGFRLTASQISRAGMDYWDQVDVHIWDTLDAFLDYADQEAQAGVDVRYIETRTPTSIGDWTVAGPTLLVFGSESSGIPEEVQQAHPERLLRIPMGKEKRSLNLSNAVAITLFEALRQQGYQCA